MRPRICVATAALLGAMVSTEQARAQFLDWRASIGVTAAYNATISESTSQAYSGMSLSLSPSINGIYETPRTQSTLTYAFSLDAPFLEQANAYQLFNLTVGPFDAANDAASRQKIKFFSCPSDPHPGFSAAGATYGWTNYHVNSGTWGGVVNRWDCPFAANYQTTAGVTAQVTNIPPQRPVVLMEITDEDNPPAWADRIEWIP